MEYPQRVKAEVLYLGQKLPYYPDPDNELDHRPRFHIKAHTGAKFSHRVGRIVANSTDRTCFFRVVSRYDSSTDTWRKSDLCFGKLRTGMQSFS